MGAVLVTGAAGFVGSHLLELLAHDAAEIVAWLRPGTQPAMPGGRVRWMAVEMQDRDAVLAAIAEARPAQVYHLAGVPHVGDSWSHTHETFAGNVLSTHYLFDALRRQSLAPRVLITSSATVYTPSSRAITEADPVNPNSPYGTSKLAQEMVARRSWEDDGIPGLIARAFNHVGPRQSPAFVLLMGNMEPQRDIMDVRDTVRAYRAMMHAAMPGAPYNVCSGTATAVRTLVDLFVSKARVKIEIKQDHSRFRPNDTPVVLGDRSRIQNDTGWEPTIPLEQTVVDLLAHWRQQVA
jgi:GDP-4-dehydro-6-deoxy-D-mannose reductase